MNKKNIVIALLLVLNIVLFSLCIHYKNDKFDIFLDSSLTDESKLEKNIKILQ